MKNPKKLTLKQKKFLVSEGLDPNEFMLIAAPSDCYKFFHKPTKKEVIMRR